MKQLILSRSYKILSTVENHCSHLLEWCQTIWQNFNKGTKIHTIEIWNIDSKKYPEILSSEYFGILIPNSNWGTKLSHISDSVYSREEYHTCLMQILFNVNPNPYFSFYLSSFVNINISCYIEITIPCCETNWTIN